MNEELEARIRAIEDALCFIVEAAHADDAVLTARFQGLHHALWQTHPQGSATLATARIAEKLVREWKPAG